MEVWQLTLDGVGLIHLPIRNPGYGKAALIKCAPSNVNTMTVMRR